MSNLPDTYLRTLDDLHVSPLWDGPLARMLPGPRPMPGTVGKLWRYGEIRPQLDRAAELTTVEEAERRVLALINPGFEGKPTYAATPNIYLGLQIIKPGEWAPQHKHTPGAARVIVEGEGAYTAVDGVKVPMSEGDVILTPPLHWHEHSHEGQGPMVWLDVLDIPVAVSSGASLMHHGDRTETFSNRPDTSETLYRCAGLVPYRLMDEPRPDYPMMRFAWRKVREALVAIAEYAGPGEPIHMAYANPETGASVLKPLNFSVRMLRPGEELRPRVTSASATLHVIEGSGQTEIDGETFDWDAKDNLAVPCYAEIRHVNTTSKPAFVLQVDDAPLLQKLGYFEAL
ncbi:MAG: cupin domain-containing protein [Pseudomonadota bacterium]|nr:cupin domain-containing protein [Pseudomonadota bacterium]